MATKKAPAVDIQQRPLKHSHGALLSAYISLKARRKLVSTAFQPSGNEIRYKFS